MMKSLRIKRLLPLLIWALAAISQQALSNPVSPQQALFNTQSFLQHRGKAVAAISLRQAQMIADRIDAQPAYYIFNIGSGDGYVIASGDDCTPAILGYSDIGSFDADAVPCNMQWWLDEYARQIQFMRDNGLSASRSPRRLSSMPAVPPLLTTGWDQVDPYNRLCPVNPSGNHYVTGCVATAMAQVLYFHRANSVSQTTHEMPAYVTPGGVYVEGVPAGSFIDWDNMLDSYWQVSATDEQKDAVARLMKYCGSAVHMNYKSGGSSAQTESVPSAMIAYFNYNSRAEAIHRNSSGLSDEEWENLVYSELSHSRPLLYSGSRPTSTPGHAFVCDGYDGEGYFHINWGWGKTQGYYLLTAIDSIGTSLLTYHLAQQAIFFAEPRKELPSHEGGVSFADPIAEALCLHSCDVNDDGVLTMDEVLATTDMGPFDNTCIASFDEFQYFTGITAVTNRMFASCESLKSITLHDQITRIGKSAFFGCRSLKEFTMPCSVTVLQAQAFSDCDSLKHFIWNGRNCGLEFMATLPNSVESLTFGDSVIMIPNTVAKNLSIKKMTIGKSVTRIGSSAFYKCTGLKRVIIPNSVVTISNQAFYECTGLDELVLGNAVATIGDRAFEFCSNLKWLSIPNSVTSIGSYAFRGCTGLRSVVIGKSVSTLKTMAFDGCESLKVVTCLLPEPLAINSNVFKGLYDNVTLRVPAEALEAYRETAPWNQFAEIVPIDPSSGDVNLDGVTSIDDITDLINQLLADTSTEYSDVNGDGLVNIDDVVDLINKLLANTH